MTRRVNQKCAMRQHRFPGVVSTRQRQSSARSLVILWLLASVGAVGMSIKTASIELISVTASGAAGGAELFDGFGLWGPASVKDERRRVVFVSASDQIVPGDTNGFEDVFVRDRQTAVTTLVSRVSDGSLGNCPCGVPEKVLPQAA